MKEKMILERTVEGSLAHKAGLKGGEEIVSLNDNPDFELVDFIYSTLMDEITFEIRADSSKITKFKLERGEESDFGLNLSSFPIKRCKNKCIFCYIDQLPKGLRDSLYIKDDDYQLSFFKGSYISLSNFSLRDLEKIKEYSLSPIYISLHSTDKNLRNYMMGNPYLEDPLDIIRVLSDNNISMYFQIVLCPGINDGNHLIKTIEDVAGFYPLASSIAIVPASSTKYRANPKIIKSIDPDYSQKLINQMKPYQKKFKEKYEESFVYLSDEFYISSGLDIPENDEYDSYPQIENGVGISRSFLNVSEESIKELKSCGKKPNFKLCSIITGKLSEGLWNTLSNQFKEHLDVDIHVYAPVNQFLGDSITVTGLLTGKDIVDFILKEKPVEPIIIPDIIFSDVNGLTLDNMTQDVLRSATGKDIVYVSSSSIRDFISLLYNKK